MPTYSQEFHWKPTLANLGLALLRLHVGWTMAQAGYDKFPVDAWFTGQVSDLGFPLPALFAFLASFSEFAGGVLLILGLATRPAALLMAITMGVAAFAFHKVTPVTSINIAHTYFWVLLMFFFVGGGGWSLDDWLLAASPEGEKSRVSRRGRASFALILLVSLGGFAFYRNSLSPPAPTASDEVTQVSVAGSFNDWNVEALPMEQGDEQKWAVAVPLEGPQMVEFKFVGNQNWEQSTGEENQESNSLPLEGSAEPGTSAENIKVYLPVSGKYQFRIDLSDLSYRVEKIE